jgi:paraquat-inducible protein A
MQLLPPSAAGQKSECARCLKILAGSATGRIGAPLALSFAALLLLVPATIAPLLLVTTYGADREAWLHSTVEAMWRDGFASLGVLIAVFAIALPYAFLGLLIWVLGNLHWQTGTRVGSAFRWAKHLRPWVMIEVFLIGSFVSYSRIKTGILVLIALIQLDERTVWETLRPQRRDPSRAPGRDETVACIICDLIVRKENDGKACPRCAATLHSRKPQSIQRTAAFVIAGYLLYIPANTLPVLTTVQFGREDHNTILSGVIELVHNDLVPLAVIVFMASIVLPLVKLFGLTWMLVATRARSSRFLVTRTRLYRTIDTIGRWSNIDIFSVAMLVAVLQFGSLTAVHSGPGLVAFAAVVILTMLATAVFDSRLMWDAVAGTVTERE